MRLLLIMALFTLCRVLLYLLNTNLFPDMTFGHFMQLLYAGLPFDLAAVLYTNCLYILLFIIPLHIRYRKGYQKYAAGIFHITNSVALAANCIDFIYFRYTLRRTTWSVFREFANEAGNIRLFGRFLVDYWYVVLLFIALVIIMTWTYRRFKIRLPFLRNNWLYYGAGLVTMVVCVLLTIAGVRGGFTRTTRPISINNAATYANNPTEIGIVLNTPFSIYRTIERKNYPRISYFSSEGALNAVYTPIHMPADNAVFTPKNVVIIILESIGREYIGALNKDRNIDGYVSYTPFLDSLIPHGLSFKRSFANGRKSIDVLPSVLASIPSFSDPYVLSVYANNRIEGLAALLNRKGYDCSFFHGAPNNSMGFQSFARMSGFTHYYGKNDYDNNADFDGFWGIWDEPFLQFMARTLNTKTVPFLASVFMLSSHHPYQIPARYDGKFPKGEIQMHQCAGYADYALHRFFETAATMPWYENTLFVITADHTNQTYYPPYSTSVGNFEIPVILYAPGDKALQGLHDTPTAQQIDIMPTVLSYLHFDEPFFAFGANALDAAAKTSFAINYVNGVYQILQDGYVLHTKEEGPSALYQYETDPLLKENLLDRSPERVKAMENAFKAFIQQYNNKLIDNKMAVNRKKTPEISGVFSGT